MTINHHIQYLKRKELDPLKWDLRISESRNSLIYARSTFLDHMAKNWDALVVNDYEYVMPLTFNKKWGIKYLYQPPFTQQLGVFSKCLLTPDILRQFMEAVNDRFRFADIFLNYENTYFPNTVPRTNCILNLTDPYSVTRNNFKNDLIRCLKIASQFDLSYDQIPEPQYAIEMHKKLYMKRTPHVKKFDYENLLNLSLDLLPKNEMIIRAISGPPSTILSLAMLLRDSKRIYLIISATSPEGRRKKANHLLIDSIIKEFSNNQLTLDFEGSDIPGIAHFYYHFGAQNQPYYFYNHNKLPWPASILK